MSDCEHKHWGRIESLMEVVHEPGGSYLVLMVECDDCQERGEFSNHILNVVHDEDVVWGDP